MALTVRRAMGEPAAFAWRFGKFHAYTYTASPNLEKNTHPLYEFTKRRWNTRSEPLWVSVIAKKHTGIHNSRCVRSWLSRRLRIAVNLSLKKNGYAPDGTRLEGPESGNHLWGTAQFLAEQPMIKMSQEQVQEQTDKAVLEIIRLQEPKVKKVKSGSKSPSKNPPELEKAQ
ncbi:hypothetical protein M430DRAFT_34087 [Amorphotheca resinae ATCC 22711]|uniref:Uncharacterized protein n=1 Tax=Amorphotheca resinae ATCC 22711 TaxID=857342 RepID=A0A2T3B5N6_AMORE|nr:hypothetical protein M430DRAFT_34087 [Amorphotheca resinae ATCC 22711]PSS22080.1 hypothetical protein M430DRAFT_34087 [Amorphotheca resinae ATCC 22711]